MRISIFLEIILILLALVILKTKNLLRAVIFLAVFSLVISVLYFVFQAPDVALAEAAIGSAISTFLFLIAIEKQKEFLVISHINTDFLHRGDDDLPRGEGYHLLKDFCSQLGLKIKVDFREGGEIKGILRDRNVDLIVDQDPKSKKYLLKAKKSSLITHQLMSLTRNMNHIRIIALEDRETDE
ncbi:MAG: DUF4040 domain-containing protein [Thermotaleaceae bacterium]